MLPGPKFASGQVFWLGLEGRPRLSSFVSAESSLLFRAIDQQPRDLAWLRWPIDEWKNSLPFMDFSNFIKKKAVVNDCAER